MRLLKLIIQQELYSFLKVLAKDNDHLMEILSKIQKLKGVMRTETFISLEQSISRQLKV